nr:hypothetical protein [Tanacetum cinerariifolium]
MHLLLSKILNFRLLKRKRLIDRLARSLLIQGIPNDIYSLIDSNETAKDLWDALERQMRGSEYAEQDRKSAIFMSIRLSKLLKESKITALLAKAFNRRKFYSKPTNNNLRTSSTSQSANKKQEFVKTNDKKVEKKANEKKGDMSKVKYYNCKNEGHFAKYCKKAKVKDYNYYKTKFLLAKKDSDEQVLLAEDQAWIESNNSDESSSSAEETIAEVAYHTSESESEFEFETLEYYDNSTNYSLFVNNDDDQEIFHDAIESASEKFIENHIDSQKDYDKIEVDHNDSEEKEHLVDKLIQKFNHKIAKCQKCIEKANQQTEDLENQNKDLQEKYDVLINQVNTFEEKNNEFNEQKKVLNENNVDLLAQMDVLQDQLKVKHVVIDTHTECQAQYPKLEEERYEYMIRYSALCDNDKQHRKKIDEQEILFDKMSQVNDEVKLQKSQIKTSQDAERNEPFKSVDHRISLDESIIGPLLLIQSASNKTEGKEGGDVGKIFCHPTYVLLTGNKDGDVVKSSYPPTTMANLVVSDVTDVETNEASGSVITDEVALEETLVETTSKTAEAYDPSKYVEEKTVIEEPLVEPF